MYGGSLATTGQFRAIVFIYTEWTFINYFNHTVLSDDQKCGGAILSSRWVLTAAHCLPHALLYNRHYHKDRYKITKVVIMVTAGCVYLHSKGCHRTLADRYIPHDEAVRDVMPGDRGFIPGVDVALLRMARPFRFGMEVGSTALLGSPMPFKVNTCYAVGFGDQHAADTADDRLHFVPLAAGNHSYCLQVALRPRNVRHYHVCSHNDQDERRMTCLGDSGSPLYCGGLAVGVLAGSSAWQSDGLQCGDKVQDDLYTATLFLYKWIRDTTNDDSIVFRHYHG